MRMIWGALLCAVTVAPAHAQEMRFERPYWTDKPVLEALGRAEVEVLPNRASFSASFTATANAQGEATARVADRARLAAAAVRARAGKDARIATDVVVRPIYDTYRDRDGNVLTYDTPDRIKEYAATASLRVTVLDVAKASEARAAALAAKPDETGDIGYSLDLTADVERRAFAAAVEDAALRAKAAAGAAGATLGPLLVLQEGDGPCLGRWYTPQPGLAQPMMAMAPPPPPAMASDVIVATASGREMKINGQEIAAMTLPSDPTPQRVQARVCLVYAAAR